MTTSAQQASQSLPLSSSQSQTKAKRLEAKNQITIVGLGLIGTSLGLALGREERSYAITGHDRDSAAMQRAKKLNAIDNSHWNLINACTDADLIILAIPTAGIPPTLEAIKQDLKPGCLIIDTAPIMTPILQAAEVLPNDVHFVGANPLVLSRVSAHAENASPDLFKGVPWAICATPDTAEQALKTTTELITFIGAEPVFLDATEHDGLMAAVDGMPTVLAAILLEAIGANPAWRELRRMVGSQFESATRLPYFEPDDFSANIIGNRDNIITWLDAMTAELQNWRKALAEDDEEAINAHFATALEYRGQWESLRKSGDWDELDDGTEIEAPGMIGRLFGFHGGKKKRTR